ncbi:MAG TPA: helix-turn-helix domain-containing protein [Symbiobacteriaceae bacterium]|nr:helix-turn-helix domain-containing protein [Symbiobacteriaceae bacterium]
MHHLDLLSTLGHRIRIFRLERGLTLRNLADRSQLALGYLAQLENGDKLNPTLDALCRVAGALGVTLQTLLFAEIPSPRILNPEEIHQAFRQYLTALPIEKRVCPSAGERAARVVDFLYSTWPNRFTQTALATGIGLSVRGLNDLLAGGGWSDFHLGRLSQLTGIDQGFWETGRLDA